MTARTSGPGPQYPDNWDSLRKSVYRRDEYTCQDCGKKGGPHGDVELHAHHKIPISNGGSHDMNNLITLCKYCHDDRPGHDILPYEEKSQKQQRKELRRWIWGEIAKSYHWNTRAFVLSFAYSIKYLLLLGTLIAIVEVRPLAIFALGGVTTAWWYHTLSHWGYIE